MSVVCQPRWAAGCALLATALLASPAGAHPGIDEQLHEVESRLAAEPQNAALLVRRAQLHRLHGNVTAAEADYRRALDIDPGRDEITLWLAELHLVAGDADRALRLLDPLLLRVPEDPAARVVRARARARLGDPVGAAADFTMALADPGAGPELYLERAAALSAATPPQAEAALIGLEEGLARLGGAITLESKALDIELGLGRHDAALARLDRVAATMGRRETWLARKAEILEAIGRSAEAAECYRLSLAAIDALDPGRRGSRNVLALESSARAALARLSGG